MNFAVFKTLDRRQMVCVVQAYFKLWWVAGKLKFANPDWLMEKIEFGESIERRYTEGNRKQKSTANLPLGIARNLHESIRLAARLNILQLDCLPKSIVLAEMLETRGILAAVKVGVSKNGEGDFASHAWVEIDKVMVAEPETVSTQFRPLS